MSAPTADVFFYNFGQCEVRLDLRERSLPVLQVGAFGEGWVNIKQPLDVAGQLALRGFCDAILAERLPATFVHRRWLRRFSWVAKGWQSRRHASGRDLTGTFTWASFKYFVGQSRFTVAPNVMHGFCERVLASVNATAGGR